VSWSKDRAVLKTFLLFPGTALTVAVIAFAFGYRTPTAGSLRTVATKVEPAREAALVSTNHASAARSSSNLISHDDLRVEGFAKIGFAEMEGLLTTSSPEQRERWVRELGALPDNPLKPIALIAFYSAWLDLKPEEALASLRKFPVLQYRAELFGGVHSAVPTTLLPQLIDIIAELSEAERRVLLPSYFTSLAQTDPVAAARFIDSHPKFDSSENAVALMSVWARDDIDSAKKWLEASRFSTDPGALQSLVESWLARDSAAARDYVVLHRDDAGMSEAINSVAVYLFKTSPEQTREFLLMFDQERASEILWRLRTSAPADQVGKLAVWASTLPSELAAGNLGSVLAHWNSLNPTEALAWLRERPATERDSLVAEMIRSQQVLASPEILALAYKIGDPRTREDALATLVESFSGTTGEATEQIRALGLSVSQTNHLLELLAAPKR
jgi:hypothetical protein